MANPKSDGKGGVGFDGHRYHCGTHSHRKAKASTWMSKWPNRARGAAKANERERETRQYSARAREEDEEEEETDRVVETEWSTSDRESATDDAWWLGSVNALSRECEMCRAQPPPTMSVANRFAVLAGDVDGDVQLSCQRFGSTNTAKHTGGIQRDTTMRSPEPGQRQKVSWNAAELLPVDPRTTSQASGDHNGVCCFQGCTNRRTRLVEAVADSGAEENVAPPKLFPGEIRASAMSRVGKYSHGTLGFQSWPANSSFSQ